MSMTFDQLVTLYILQKNYHLKKDDPIRKIEFQRPYVEFIDKLNAFGASAADGLAPALFANQPNIPFILFCRVE